MTPFYNDRQKGHTLRCRPLKMLDMLAINAAINATALGASEKDDGRWGVAVLRTSLCFASI